MKIRFLALSELYVPQKGGHVIWFHEICNRLGQVKLLTRKEDGYPDKEMSGSVEIMRVFMRRVNWCIPQSLPIYANLFFRGLFAAINSDVVLSARVIPEGFVGCFISKFKKIPNAVIVHGEEINRLKTIEGKNIVNSVIVYLKKKIIWGTLERSDLIIANSSFTKQLVLDGGIPENKVKVVHPGTDPVRFYPKDKNVELVKRFGLEGKTVLLATGRLTPRKGQDMTIRALPEIVKKFPGVVYMIVGNGEYENELKSLVKECSVEKHVVFCDSVSNELLPDMYNLCDLFMMPNRTLKKSNDVEGFGIVFLEANACGKPVLGGLSGGVPDSVVDGMSGLLISADCPENISKSVIELLSDRGKMKKMGLWGRQRVLDRLTWQHSADDIARYVSDLLS